ncbi:MAG: phage terminase large subunit [SAR324 cluster bacterium]|nr:phage terminase large subunit [SAR324 cluster bacterium]
MARLNLSQLNKSLGGLKKQLLKEIAKAATPLDQNLTQKRRRECRANGTKFINTYLPHYFPEAQFSAMHKDYFQVFTWMASSNKRPDKRGLRKALAAPRGNAKTSMAKALMLYCIVYGLKHFIVYISDTLAQAAESLVALKVELEENPRLGLDFPEVCGVGPVWNQSEMLTKNGIKVKIFGTGKRIRGASHGTYRPDLILGDDLENDENCQTPMQRENLYKWLWKGLLPLGPPDESHDVIIQGTVLHYDSLLARLLASSSFTGVKFQAVISWPTQSKLWDEFSTLYNRVGRGTALGYYEANKKQMDRGAKVLWPKVQPLVVLMGKKAEEPTSFSSEYQNEPMDENERIFDMKAANYWETWASDVVFVGAVDPSMGGSAKSDPSAIVILGVSVASGKLQVMEAEIARTKPDQLIVKLIEYQKKYKCVTWAVETIQFQEFFKSELLKSAAKAGVLFPAVGVKPHSDKGLRIKTLQPYVVNGAIEFNKSHYELLAQMEQFPKAAHDDGPDALQMAVAIAVDLLESSSGGGVFAAPLNREHGHHPAGLDGSLNMESY